MLAKTKKLITLVWVVSEIFKAPTAKREKYTSNQGLIFHELQIIRVDFKIFIGSGQMTIMKLDTITLVGLSEK